MMNAREQVLPQNSHSLRPQVDQYGKRAYQPVPSSQALYESGFKGDLNLRRAPDLYDPVDSYRGNGSALNHGLQHRSHDGQQDYEMGRNRTSRDNLNTVQSGYNLPRDHEGDHYRLDDKRPELSRDVRADSRYDQWRQDGSRQDGRREAELRREKERLLEEKRKEEAMRKELQRKEDQQKRLEDQRKKEQERKIEEQRKRERELKERERKLRERERFEREEKKRMEELKVKEAKLRRLEELAMKEKELKEKERKLKEDMRRKEEEDRRLAEIERKQIEEFKRREAAEERRKAAEERRRREKEDFEIMERRRIQEEEENLERMIRDRERKLCEREEELMKMEQMTEMREREYHRDLDNIKQKERQRMEELHVKQRELEEMEYRQRELELIELREKALREKETLHREFHKGSSSKYSHLESSKSRSKRSALSNKKYSKEESIKAKSSSKRSYDLKNPGLSKPDKKNKSAFQRLDVIDVDNTKKDDADEKRGSAFERLGEKISIKSRLGGKFSSRKAVPTAGGMEITVQNRGIEMEVLDEIGQVEEDEAFLAEQKEKERELKERLQKELNFPLNKGEEKLSVEKNDQEKNEKWSGEDTELTNNSGSGKRKSEVEPADLDSVVIKKRAKTPASENKNGEEKSLKVHTPTNLVGRLALILKDLPKPAVEAAKLTEEQKSVLKKKFTKKFVQSEVPDKILLLALANVNYDESLANLLVSRLIKQMSAPPAENTQSPVQEEVDLNENGDEEKLDYEVD